MTLLARVLYLFPVLHMSLIGAAALSLIAAPGVGTVVGLLAVVYLLPVGLFRLHDALWPLREGRSSLLGAGYNPWWGASQLQWTFIAFPSLEVALRGVPGLFSLWLRAWGARVGAGVIWTPELVILDRSLLEIGDRVVFGYQVGLSGHLVSGKELELVLAKIRIGRGSLVGAGAKIFPGVTIGEKVVLGAEARLASYVTVGDRVHMGAFCRFDAKVEVPAGTRVEAHTVMRLAEESLPGQAEARSASTTGPTSEAQREQSARKGPLQGDPAPAPDDAGVP